MPESIGSELVREVRLYGHLGKRYGRVHRLAVATAREAAQALGCMFKGFARDVIEHQPGHHVFVGQRDVDGNLGADQLDVKVAAGETIYFVPVVAGAKSGLLTVIVGAAIFVAGLMTGGAAWVLYAGAAIVGAGLVQMLMPSVKASDSSASGSSTSSYAFGNTANVTEQGVAVPVVYGEVIAGSVVASQGLTSVELAV